MNSPAREALKRAMLRISAHSWCQGPNGSEFSGYSLKTAIIGKLAVGQAERDALGFATDAAQFIYPAQDLPNDDAFLDSWNDKPGRTSEQVLTVLNIAIGRACSAPEPIEISPAVDSAAPIAAPAAVIPAPDETGIKEATQMLRDIHAGNQETIQTIKATVDAISASGGDATPISPVVSPPPPELVAEAIALGYEADNTWTEDRLKGAIAAAKATDAKLAANAPVLPPPITPMPDPLASMKQGERASFFMDQNSPRTKP